MKKARTSRCCKTLRVRAGKDVSSSGMCAAVFKNLKTKQAVYYGIPLHWFFSDWRDGETFEVTIKRA